MINFTKKLLKKKNDKRIKKEYLKRSKKYQKNDKICISKYTHLAQVMPVI